MSTQTDFSLKQYSSNKQDKSNKQDSSSKQDFSIKQDSSRKQTSSEKQASSRKRTNFNIKDVDFESLIKRFGELFDTPYYNKKDVRLACDEAIFILKE